MTAQPADRVTIEYDPNSTVRIVVDTPMKRFYQEQVEYLNAGDFEGLVNNHYHEDAVLLSAERVVRGRDALKRHYAKYTGLMAFLEVVSTDKWIESETTFAFEATARTQWGISRVHDAFLLRDGKIAVHFTGGIPLLR